MCECVCVCAYMQRGIAALFAKRAAIRRTCQQKQGLRRRLQDNALRRGHQSAALLVGEKRCTCRHVFKCCHGVFFLTYTVCGKSLIERQ